MRGNRMCWPTHGSARILASPQTGGQARALAAQHPAHMARTSSAPITADIGDSIGRTGRSGAADGRRGIFPIPVWGRTGVGMAGIRCCPVRAEERPGRAPDGRTHVDRRRRRSRARDRAGDVCTPAHEVRCYRAGGKIRGGQEAAGAGCSRAAGRCSSSRRNEVAIVPLPINHAADAQSRAHRRCRGARGERAIGTLLAEAPGLAGLATTAWRPRLPARPAPVASMGDAPGGGTGAGMSGPGQHAEPVATPVAKSGRSRRTRRAEAPKGRRGVDHCASCRGLGPMIQFPGLPERPLR